MKIILEGCDGTGKTTLAQILANRYGLDVVHCTQHDAADFDFYRQTLRKENVVWDRHTLGELIYPSVFNRKPCINGAQGKMLMRIAKQEGVKVLVLTTDTELLRKRLLLRGGEDKRILQQLERINRLFKFYAKMFDVPIIDTSKMTLEEIFNLIEEKEIH